MTDKRDALVFDYDGVLADTEPLHWKSWAVLLSQYDVQLGWDDYCRFGRGVNDSQLVEIFRERGLVPDTADLQDQNRERKRMVKEWSLAEVPIPSATIRLLKALNEFRIGLVTSSDRSDVEPVLRAAKIFDVFDAMVFGEDVSTPKPSPVPYQLVARRLEVSTGIAFEDSEPGLRSAMAAGFRAVRVEQPGDLPRIVARSLNVGHQLK